MYGLLGTQGLEFLPSMNDRIGIDFLDAFQNSTRLVFDLSATREGISHQLGITPKAADGVLGDLRAAIPSLRLDKTETPKLDGGQRLLWQLVPAAAVIRTDELGAIAAAQLASL